MQVSCTKTEQWMDGWQRKESGGRLSQRSAKVKQDTMEVEKWVFAPGPEIKRSQWALSLSPRQKVQLKARDSDNLCSEGTG